MRSSFYYSKSNIVFANKLKSFLLNFKGTVFSNITLDSPRAVGDALQTIISDNFALLIGEWSDSYSNQFARRAMADLAFEDKEGFYNIIDIKTHRINSDFNMPALTSVKRLSRFYEDDMNIFAILMIEYSTTNNFHIEKVYFYPIEFFDWSCLTVGALGWGQIQIKDSNSVTINNRYSRKLWMLHLCETMCNFEKHIQSSNRNSNPSYI